jgi:hypothetical protein
VNFKNVSVPARKVLGVLCQKITLRLTSKSKQFIKSVLPPKRGCQNAPQHISRSHTPPFASAPKNVKSTFCMHSLTSENASAPRAAHRNRDDANTETLVNAKTLAYLSHSYSRKLLSQSKQRRRASFPQRNPRERNLFLKPSTNNIKCRSLYTYVYFAYLRTC